MSGVTQVRAERYTHGHAESVLRAHAARTAKDCLAYGVGYLQPGMTVLDVGCGPGTITADIAQLVAPGRVLAVDLDAGVLEQAREHARTRGITNIDFRVMDAYALACADDFVDFAHAHQVLHHMSDPVAVLREMKRVTRPGGRIAVRESVDLALTWYPDNEGISAWQRLFRELIRANGGDPAAGRYLFSWAHKAGLTDVVASSSSWTYSAGSSARWWGQLWADRLLGSSITDQLIGEGLATMDELQAVAEGWLEWSEHPDAWFMVPCGEILATVD